MKERYISMFSHVCVCRRHLRHTQVCMPQSTKYASVISQGHYLDECLACELNLGEQRCGSNNNDSND